ncbi:GAF domain-containing sensor histidine kinase [Donghicola tyrosinivorans]|uniref:histidine kinase n=1 Tax=Donghicola tyrosinivorans TaxID=1652492 RepID=A0A2T0WKW0_9RHOB|nr:ATP-binding protein [Donghicola tyrosinivorans]PRY87343.1 histidine kinase/DNA gyrase B/HSP90-like ATPase [Donghicola tyrosinivorans]
MSHHDTKGCQSEHVLARIAGRLAQQTDVRTALMAIERDIAALIPFVHCDICLLDRPGWVVSHEVGIRTRWSRASGRIDHAPIRELLFGQCDFMLTSDATCDLRFTYPGAACEPILNHQLRSRVHVPLRVKGQLIGALNLSDRQVGTYGAGTVAQAQEIADVLAPWFHILHLSDKAQRSGQGGAMGPSSEEGLRRGALELTQAMEHERQRIGMDLHDQTLADLSRLLREVTAEAPLPRAELAVHLRETITGLRRIIDEAVPTLLELFGFTHAVRVHLERASGEAVQVDVQDLTHGLPDTLDTTVRSALFHITQEAINNATTHAGAGRITVNIDQPTATSLTVTVSDDGCGIPAAPARQSGLMHMRTRARLISAGLDILPDHGTTVRVTLRVPNQQQTGKGAA